MKQKSLTSSRERWGLIFIAPQFISLIFMGLIPVVVAFALGFFEWNGYTAPVFNGIENFKSVFSNPDTFLSIKNSLVYVVIYVPCTVALALALALLLNVVIGKNFYRAVFFMPQIVNSVAIAVVWTWIFQPQFGILNMILKMFGATPQDWLKNPSLAMGAVIAMSVWWGVGYNIVLFLAGLQNVPRTYVEAAKVDGATERDIFFKITLPMISPTTLFITITTMINAFQAVDQMMLLTNGGPIKRTYTITLYIYRMAFKNFRLGEASTIALILFAIVVTISLVQFKLSDKWVYYD